MQADAPAFPLALGRGWHPVAEGGSACVPKQGGASLSGIARILEVADSFSFAAPGRRRAAQLGGWRPRPARSLEGHKQGRACACVRVLRAPELHGGGGGSVNQQKAAGKEAEVTCPQMEAMCASRASAHDSGPGEASVCGPGPSPVEPPTTACTPRAPAPARPKSDCSA